MKINMLGGMALAIASLGLGAVSFGEEAKKDDATVIAEQLATYPLQTCLVSGEKLGGDMGAPVDYVYQGRLVRFCCKGCIKKFNADPEKFLKLIDEAAAKAKAGGTPKSGGQGHGHGGTGHEGHGM